jgi:hypothetical protein
MSRGSTVSAQNDQTHSCFVMVPPHMPKKWKAYAIENFVFSSNSGA